MSIERDITMILESDIFKPASEGDIAQRNAIKKAEREKERAQYMTPEIKNSIDRYPEGILRDTAYAYADNVIHSRGSGWSDLSADSPSWETLSNIRDLDWPGEQTDYKTFLKQVEIVGDYNEFGVSIARDLVNVAGEDSMYRLAREGSVAVYVKLTPERMKTNVHFHQKDLEDVLEVDEFTLEDNGEYRLWWD